MRVYAYTDWSQMESWLTAHFSGDATLRSELEAQLVGGPKVHALNAQLLYGCEPTAAEATQVNFQGQLISAYDAAKRGSHGFNYGMGPGKMAKHFWISMSEATRIHKLLSAKYAAVVAWREALADDVYGVRVFRCPNCMRGYRGPGACETCRVGRSRVPLRFVAEERVPRKIHVTPFARRRLYLGSRKDGMNAVASQDPQSSGASVWLRTFERLHGWDPMVERPWPTPPGVDVLTWNPTTQSYGDLAASTASSFLATGTYDSFVNESEGADAEVLLDWQLWTCEQPWPELQGLRLPAEGAIGSNWRAYHETENPNGLRKIKRRAFEYRGSYANAA